MIEPARLHGTDTSPANRKGLDKTGVILKQLTAALFGLAGLQAFPVLAILPW
jgi:hypothetical protein